MAVPIDITGHKFGRLTAIKSIYVAGKPKWICECECGGSIETTAGYLRSGNAKSCGCLKHKSWASEKKRDLSGEKFHSLTVIRATSHAEWGWLNWLCKCDCGKEVVVAGYRLVQGKIQSCGCARGKAAKHNGCANGKSEPIYQLWHHMKQRCYRKRNDNYATYGGRGITVCDEWRDNYPAFREWAIANGYRKGLQIDRIDNDGPYSPDNCQFTSPAKNTQKQPQVKLTPRRVLVIRRLMERTTLTAEEVGRLFGVTRSAVTAINRRERWASVTEADWKRKC
jgi:hypothetical protein